MVLQIVFENDVELILDKNQFQRERERSHTIVLTKSLHYGERNSYVLTVAISSLLVRQSVKQH